MVETTASEFEPVTFLLISWYVTNYIPTYQKKIHMLKLWRCRFDHPADGELMMS